MKKSAIISGITGQDGAYLAKLLLTNNYNVVGLVRGYNSNNYQGLHYLNIKDKVTLVECDLLDITQILNILQQYKPDEFYNLSAQSSVSQSFQQPIGTFQFNTISVFNLLEAVKLVEKRIRFYQASSSEMYGKVNSLPITENSIFHPLSPYAVSKAAAHFTCIHYRESYNMFICCGILFNHESYLRKDTFFIKKIIQDSIKISQGKLNALTIGNIDIKRDFGYAPKYVEAIYLMMQKPVAKDYIICSGQSVILRDLIYHIFNKLGLSKNKCQVNKQLFRPNDIKDLYGDNSNAKTELNWRYDLNAYELMDLLLEEELVNIKKDSD
jgi:GDPmannose 4,6-dehydratase